MPDRSPATASTASFDGQFPTVYRFGDADIAFEGDADWLMRIERRFGKFRSVVEPSFVVRRRVETMSHTEIAPSPRVEISAAADGFRIAGAGFHADVDLRKGEALLREARDGGAVDVLVKRLVPHLVTSGLVLHGALAEQSGIGLALSGPSGAGKSTISTLLGQRSLCDELLLLRFRDDRVVGESLPCWIARPGAAELRAVVMLAHAREHRLHELSAPEASRRVTAQVMWALYAPSRMQLQLELLDRLLARIPVYELGFTPTPDVWAFLERELLARPT